MQFQSYIQVLCSYETQNSFFNFNIILIRCNWSQQGCHSWHAWVQISFSRSDWLLVFCNIIMHNFYHFKTMVWILIGSFFNYHLKMGNTNWLLRPCYLFIRMVKKSWMVSILGSLRLN